jgi:hypothetical protein
MTTWSNRHDWPDESNQPTSGRLIKSVDIRALGLDLRRMCFAFSPDYLSAVAKKRFGRAGIFAIDVRGACCLVPAVLFKRKFLKVVTLLAPPSDYTGGKLPPGQELEALHTLADHLRRSGLAHRITQPSNWSLFQIAPKGGIAVPFGSYVLSLTVGIEVIWQNLHQKHRNVIRRAEREGVAIAHGPSQLAPFLALYNATMHRNDMSHESQSFFEDLLQSDDFNVFCGVAYVGQRPVAALFAPYNSYGAYYLFGGTSEKIGTNGANNLLHFEAIRNFVGQGAQFYDFVGARIGDVPDKRLEGIQRFKSRFGAALHQGILWKQDLSMMNCIAYDALSALRNRAKKRVRAMDIIDQERLRSQKDAEFP